LRELERIVSALFVLKIIFSDNYYAFIQFDAILNKNIFT
jgi:hypothetical protein